MDITKVLSSKLVHMAYTGTVLKVKQGRAC